jgi:CRISPR-associated protein Cas2
MIFDFMRVILFFDLPMITKKDIRSYNQFRKYLIKNGYIMMQLSVYSKIFNNRESAGNHINILKRNVPLKGHIRIMLITEKQYSNIEVIVGGKSIQEKVVTTEAYINL